jgi:hypothetical protein
MPRDATPGLRQTLRAVALAACFAAALTVVVASSIAWLRDARLGRPTVAFNYARILGSRLPELAAARREGRATLGVLGDSGVVSYPEGHSVPERLQARLQPKVQSLGMPGAGAFDYYFVADDVARAEPDLVVIALSLDHFSRTWQRSYSRPQLAGRIAASRLGEALWLPLHWTGLTTDQLLSYVALVEAGGYEPWYWLSLRQAQVGRAWAELEAWMQGGVYVARNDTGDETPERLFRTAADEATIARLFTGPDLRHYRRAGLVDHYAETLAGIPDDHPVLAAVGATVERFVQDDIRVLVYVAPVDVAYLAEQGFLDDGGFIATLAAIEAVVVRSGGSFVDLHDALASDAFRDAPGHLAYAAEIDGPDLLADRLEPHVREALARPSANARAR